MAISAVAQPYVIPSNPPKEEPKEHSIQPRNFLFLIPTITGIVLGLLLIPNFGLGLAVGAADLAVTVVSVLFLTHAGIIEEDKEKNSKYGKHLRSSLLSASFFGPIVEEGIFRGYIQPIMTKAIQILAPAAAAALLGGGMSVAVIVGIVATAVLFGAAHLSNPHKRAHVQAISATVTGIVLGILSAQFGIGASIAAHIANNSILGTLLACTPLNADCIEIRDQKQVKFEETLPA